MTVAVNFALVADSISKLSISGVNIKDLDQIPANVTGVLPVLFPSPDGFITDAAFTRTTFGISGTAKFDLPYTMNYRFLHSPVGAGGGLVATYADLIAKLELILETILTNDTITGAVDISVQGISNIGPMFDPGQSGQYHGINIAIRVMEYT